jgi:N-acetylmuramoyl-L-alanine amidase
MSFPKILFDIGHGGKDSGAVGGSLKEKDVVLIMSPLVANYLHHFAKGEVEIHFTRLKDEYVTLAQRVEIEHKLKPDLFVSLHCNSCERPETAGGLEVLYGSEQSKGKAIAETIVVSVRPSFAIHGQGIVLRPNLYVLKKALTPAKVLVELFFINHSTDRKVFEILDTRNKLASVVAQGIWNSRNVWLGR